MDELILVVTIAGIGTGLGIIFVSTMFGLVTALADSKGWGIAIVVLAVLFNLARPPESWSAGVALVLVGLASMIYCFIDRAQKGGYPLRLFVTGLVVLVIFAAPAYYFGAGWRS